MSGDTACAALTRDSIVGEARRWIGTPYMHQAAMNGVGCDCLGLIRGVWRRLFGEEPERMIAYAPDWAEATGAEQLLLAARRHFIEVDTAQFLAGDVLLFRWRRGLPAKHLAIATSIESMVHAHDGASVCEVAISPFWRQQLAYSFSFPGL